MSNRYHSCITPEHGFISGLAVLQELHGETIVVSILGRLDGVTCEDVEQSLLIAVSAAGTGLVLDLSKLKYVSSAGLRVILTTAKQLQAAQKSFVVCGLKSPVKDVFDISGFSKIFRITDTVADTLP